VHLCRILVLTQTLVNYLAKQVVLCPSQVFDLGHELGTYPMHTAEDEGRTKAVRPRRRHLEWHLGSGETLQAPPQPAELSMVNSGSDTPSVNEPPGWIVVGKQ
jgi:hypothetical protein